MVQITSDEIKILLSGFSNSSSFQQNGVTVGGVKYMYLQSDDNQIQAKKGATGVSVAKAGKCMLAVVTCQIFVYCIWILTVDYFSDVVNSLFR